MGLAFTVTSSDTFYRYPLPDHRVTTGRTGEWFSHGQTNRSPVFWSEFLQGKGFCQCYDFGFKVLSPEWNVVFVDEGVGVHIRGGEVHGGGIVQEILIPV